jgi:LPXTG-motif cell wall-anchored protein
MGGISTQVVAAAIGAAAGLLILAGAVWFVVRRRKRKSMVEGAGAVGVARMEVTSYNGYHLPELDGRMLPAELGPRPIGEMS